MRLLKIFVCVFLLVPIANVQAQTGSLLTILQDESKDHSARKDAAEQLGSSRDTRSIEPLITLIRRGNYYAVVALRKMQHENSVAPLVGLLREGNQFAADILGKIKSKTALKAIMNAASGNSSWRVRRAAVRALSPFKTGAVKVLISRLNLDKSHWVRRSAAEALVQVKDSLVVDAFIKALKDSDQEVRRIARLALDYSDDPKAKAALLNF